MLWMLGDDDIGVEGDREDKINFAAATTEGRNALHLTAMDKQSAYTVEVYMIVCIYIYIYAYTCMTCLCTCTCAVEPLEVLSLSSFPCSFFLSYADVVFSVTCTCSLCSNAYTCTCMYMYIHVHQSCKPAIFFP